MTPLPQDDKLISEVLVEAAGVELITPLTPRKLPGSATRAKRPHCPIHCTFTVRKCFSLWSPTDTTLRPQYRIDPQRGVQKTPSSCDTVSHPLCISSVRWLAVLITSGCPLSRTDPDRFSEAECSLRISRYNDSDYRSTRGTSRSKMAAFASRLARPASPHRRC